MWPTSLILGVATLVSAPGAEAATRSECPGVRIEARPGSLPFAPGEELSYELKIGGMYVGRLDTKVGKPRRVDGQDVLTLFGRARTNGLAAQLQPFLGRYMSFIDRDTLRPIAVRVQSKYGEDQRWEKASFEPTQAAVKTDFLIKGREGKRAYQKREAPMFDLLSILYYARTRMLTKGTSACQEVYLDRRVWRMDSEVVGTSSVMTPAGSRPVYVLKAAFDRVPHPDFNPKNKRPHIDVKIFLSTRPGYVPLAFEVDNGRVKGVGHLTSWSIRGRDSDDAWEF